jgi:hypothetical protein
MDECNYNGREEGKHHRWRGKKIILMFSVMCNGLPNPSGKPNRLQLTNKPVASGSV